MPFTKNFAMQGSPDHLPGEQISGPMNPWTKPGGWRVNFIAALRLGHSRDVMAHSAMLMR
jgi:hypothetical protein